MKRNDGATKKSLPLLIRFLFLLIIAFFMQKIATRSSEVYSFWKGTALYSFENIGLLDAYYAFILIGSFYLLSKHDLPTLSLPTNKQLFAILFSSLAFMYISGFVPFAFFEAHTLFFVVLKELLFFVMLFSFAWWLLPLDSSKAKHAFTTVFLISLITIVFAILAWYDLFLVKITIAGAAFMLNLLVPTNIEFTGTQEALLSSGDFSVGIGTQCSGIESSVLFISIISLIYLIDHARIKSKKQFILWAVAGFIMSFILNIFRVSAIMLIGNYDPVFAVTTFHNYSATILFLLFVVIFVSRLYRIVMR